MLDPTASPFKRFLILNDNALLFSVLEVSLREHWPRSTITHLPESSANYDLIVIALSSPTHEPLVFLACADLAHCIGHVPLLIISDRPFAMDLVHHIFYLNFPFHADALHYQLNLITHSLAPSRPQ